MERDEERIVHVHEASQSGGEFVTHFITIYYFESNGHFDNASWYLNSYCITNHGKIQELLGNDTGGIYSKEKSEEILKQLQEMGFKCQN